MTKRPVRYVVAALLVLAGVVTIGAPANAVHDEQFQLDGDVSAATTTNVGGHVQTLDWDSFFDSAGNKKTLPTGFNASVFAKDFQTVNGSFSTSDPTTFTTGGKDTLPISSGWTCTSSNNVNSKDDLMNVYAAAGDASNGHQLLYFGLERNANTGDANIAFWFLQGNVSCPAAGNFTGNHEDGDLLIVSAFTNGGAVSTIDVYRWNGGANGTLGTTAVAHGVDCTATLANDSVCATTNQNSSITTPWQTANKIDGVGHTLRKSEFFEGGLDLTDNNLQGHCFNTFLGDTRSAQSLTSTIFDYAEGNLGECTTSVVTTPTPSGTVTIPASGSVSTSDSAAVNVTGANGPFSSSLKFFLCGPLGLNTSTTCDTGGVQIGSTQTITASGTFGSDTATVTSTGRYCWRADFSGDDSLGVPPGSDHSATECFKVNPRQPTLSTNAGAGPVTFGNPVTDTATIGNTANQPGTGGLSDGSINPTTPGAKAGGTISFTLYKDDCTTPATGTGGPFPLTTTISGDGTYGPVSFTPDAPGTYHWVATYGGNPPNTLASLASDSVCGADPNEDVVVQQIATSISTAPSAFPNDSDTITSSKVGDLLPANGTVTFQLYQAGGGKTALQNCVAGSTAIGVGGLLYAQTNSNVGGANQVTTETSNTSVAVSTDGTYYWSVVYDPGDAQHVGRQSQCLENTVLDFTQDPGPGS
jgi:hypothetical protein